MIPSDFIWSGRIYRITVTQPGGAGTEPVESESDIIPDITVAWDMKKSREEWANGTFEGRNYPWIWFRHPPLDLDIRQGDRVDVTYNGALRTFVIDGVISPNEPGHMEWRLTCSEEVDKGSC